VSKSVGRPSNKDLASTKELSKRQQAQKLREFRQRLLLNPKSEKLIEHLFKTALDDEARNQAVAMKLLTDRLLPVAGFTMDQKTAPSVSINISGLGMPDGGVTIDGTATDVEDEESEENDNELD
jgi:hypothetical protein